MLATPLLWVMTSIRWVEGSGRAYKDTDEAADQSIRERRATEAARNGCLCHLLRWKT